MDLNGEAVIPSFERRVIVKPSSIGAEKKRYADACFVYRREKQLTVIGHIQFERSLGTPPLWSTSYGLG